jgi:hypothetical protein
MYDSICDLPSAAHPKGEDSYRYEFFSHGLCGQLGLDQCVCVCVFVCCGIGLLQWKDLELHFAHSVKGASGMVEGCIVSLQCLYSHQFFDHR